MWLSVRQQRLEVLQLFVLTIVARCALLISKKWLIQLFWIMGYVLIKNSVSSNVTTSIYLFSYIFVLTELGLQNYGHLVFLERSIILSSYEAHKKGLPSFFVLNFPTLLRCQWLWVLSCFKLWYPYVVEPKWLNKKYRRTQTTKKRTWTSFLTLLI